MGTIGGGWWQVAGAIGSAMMGLGWATVGLAQIVPDSTLPVNSIVVPGCTSCVIEGGTEQGVNLYHSFREFSIPTGGSAWFNNSPQIQAILTRVTGSSLSNIDGLLKTNGTANLFFLNPNGILFGPNARLAVGGSFVASTASSWRLPDGSEFSAIAPNQPPLLTINVPIGLQPGQIPAGSTITNRGNLNAGQDLVLVGDRLELRGQLQAGGNLTLQASDTVQIRDSATEPFVATSGKDLTIQGDRAVDILTLSNPQTRIASGGDLNLISNGTISGDAHFFSGGSLSMLTLTGAPGNFVSLYDPIIYANGDVSFGNYSGAALKVEATGSITGGNIRITTPDTTIPSTDPDFAILSASPSVILRAGLVSIPSSNLPQIGSGDLLTNFTSETALAGQTSRSITVGNIDTSKQIAAGNSNAGDGGTIILETTGSIQTGTLDSRSFSNFIGGNIGNSGEIKLSAGTDINIQGTLNSSNTSSIGSGNGGAITLIAGGSIHADRVYTYSKYLYAIFGNRFLKGNGGTVSFTANGDITVETIDSGVIPLRSAGGRGGNVSLIAGGSITATGNINTEISGRGGGEGSGNITLKAGKSVYLKDVESGSNGDVIGGAANGGQIAILAGGSINANLISSSLYGAGVSGSGGKIVLMADGDITTKKITSEARFGRASENLGNGGNITLISGGNILAPSIDASSSASLTASGNGGAIALLANGNIVIGNLDSSSLADSYQSGRGGDVLISSKNGDITGTNSSILNSVSVSRRGSGGIGGNVTLEVKNNLANLEILTLSSSSKSGSVQVRGTGDLSITDIRIITSKQLTVMLPGGGSATFNVGEQGQSGDVAITGVRNLTFDNSSIQSDTKGSDPAGNVTVTSPSLITFSNSQIISNTSSTGQAGSISVTAGQGIDITGANSGLFAQTTSAGTAGNISLSAPQITLQRDAQISTTATATSTNRDGGGSITLNASDIFLAGTVGVFAETQGQTPAGTLTLRPYNNQPSLNLILAPSSRVSASTSGSGNGGDIRLTAPEAITIAGAGKVAVETTGTGNAGNITLTSPQITLADRVELSASSSNRGQAGDIRITADSFELFTGAHISTTTSGSGTAGNITVNVGDSLSLSGTNTGLFATTSPGSTGNGGNIVIDPRTVLIQDGATIAVDSQGQGIGGNITIQANRLELRDQGSITAETASTQGGNISLNVQDLLLLRRHSLISATAGTAQAGGDGGNIIITTPFIIGVLGENSDITANAFTGRGGNINITSNAIYGLQFQPQLTPFSDITASSQFGLNGTVTLNLLNVDPSRGFISLPVDLTDPTTQLDTRCQPGSRGYASSYIETGRGGVPQNPEDPLIDETVTVGWAEVRTGRRTEEGGRRTERRPEDRGQRTEERNWEDRGQTRSPETEIIEAQAIGRDRQGHLWLVAKTNQPKQFVPPECQAGGR